MWGELQQKVAPLAQVMLDSGENVDHYCNSVQCENGGTACPSRKACEFIVRGLKSIYEHKEKQDESMMGRVNNRIFRATMRCIALNAFIKKLKDEHKSCPVDEGINKAFDIGDSNRETWCKNKGSCEKCPQEQCTDYAIENEKLWDNVNEKLQADDNIQKTLSTIDILCKDCNEESNLCKRIDCVTKKWGVNRDVTNPTWDNMLSDIDRRAKDMFEHISENNADMEPHCTGHSGQESRIVTDPEKKACQYITAGLKHIYEIKEDEVKENDQEKKRKVKDDRIFKQTMECLLLNAFADELKKQVKSPCEVIEETIKQAFDAGNGQKGTWCMTKHDANNDCVQCDRYKDYRKCEISDGKNNEAVGPKLDVLFQNNNKKGEIQQTLTTISNINNLCDRSQCVITQWTRDNRGKKIKGNQIIKWEKDSWDDITRTIDPLADAMSKPDANVDSLCNSTEQKNKEACKQIVSGLMHIYQIPEEKWDDKDGKDKPRNNRLFKQTMSCFILNVYTDLIKEKCPNIGNTVRNFFTVGGNLHTTKCTRGSTCIPCEWHECADMRFDGKKLRNRIKEELKEKNNKIKQALDKICPSAKPATVQPPAAGRARSDSDDDKSAIQTGKKAQNTDDAIGLPLFDDEYDTVHHTKSNEDEEENRWLAANSGKSHVTVIDAGTTVIAGPEIKDSEKKDSNPGNLFQRLKLEQVLLLEEVVGEGQVWVLPLGQLISKLKTRPPQLFNTNLNPILNQLRGLLFLQYQMEDQFHQYLLHQKQQNKQHCHLKLLLPSILSSVKEENVKEEHIKYVVLQLYKNNSIMWMTRMVHMHIP
ncbi:SICA antigen [Plasmodium coatneyi]|uniref:SICA antigen n=1 Tax=Plasmodium coatneyi TaxID=208452 RepID=A0A1B1DTG1_9APIC|nr:SICA antigen [Plasmodium coatneyi]ANQ05929.1 SICA antigen [Plasmodium coatneyi]